MMYELVKNNNTVNSENIFESSLTFFAYIMKESEN